MKNTLQGSKQGSVSVHDNEAEPVVISQESGQGLGVEFVVTKVQGSVDWFEGFEIDVDFFLLTLLSDNGAAVHDQPVWRNPSVQFKAVLHRRDGAQHA